MNKTSTYVLMYSAHFITCVCFHHEGRLGIDGGYIPFVCFHREGRLGIDGGLWSLVYN